MQIPDNAVCIRVAGSIRNKFLINLYKNSIEDTFALYEDHGIKYSLPKRFFRSSLNITRISVRVVAELKPEIIAFLRLRYGIIKNLSETYIQYVKENFIKDGTTGIIETTNPWYITSMNRIKHTITTNKKGKIKCTPLFNSQFLDTLFPKKETTPQ